jgi:subtilisin family serine protease
VLFVELIRSTSPAHDQSTPLVDADLIRPGGTWGTRFGGAPGTLGILDTGFMLGSGAAVPHDDLNKNGCGVNFTTDAAGVWNDQNGHGTHVLATISGTGTANSRYRGVATGVGSNSRIRAAKVWNSAGTGTSAWMESAMDYMSLAMDCDSPAPLVVSMSGGSAGTNLTGTDSTSRKLDDRVWTSRQTYVIAAGNEGPGAGTIRSPGVAKNALTVGNVFDNGYLTVGDISNSSSRGPTGDGRMKPNLSAPGDTVTSARAGTTNQYRNLSGTSMATPHVSGLVATLMEHYPEFQGNPALLRAHMMSSAIAHDDVTAMSNDYGIGRVSGYLEHWAQFDANGWSTHWTWGGVSATNWHYRDITVPAGAQRLVVVLTWDEPAASAGASQAVTYDVDLYVDYLADCNEPTKGACGEYRSISSIDNVEYIVVNNPPAGLYRLKASNFRAPSFSLPVGIAATIIHGDPTPPMTASLTTPVSAVVGSTFPVTVTVSNPAYVASGVQVALTSVPAGVTRLDVQTTREDGVTMSFLGVPDALTLGNAFPGITRSATWWYRADTTGTKSFTARAWSENGGTVTPSATTQIVVGVPDLVETAAVPSPPAPIRAPGTTFQISDTVRNSGTGAAGASTTRYYLSLDGVKNAGDILLTGTRAVPGLAAGATSQGLVTVTIPSTTPLNTYSLLVCADDLNAVAESNEGNNCIVASSGR